MEAQISPMQCIDQPDSPLFAEATDPIIRLASRGGRWVVTATNDAFDRTFDSTPVSARLSSSSIVPDSSPEHRLLSSATPVTSIETDCRTRDGWRFFRLERLGTGNRTYIRYHDISDRHYRSEQLAVFTRVFRHNLRNQLNIMLAAAETKDTTPPSQLRDAVDALLETGDALSQLAILQEESDALPLSTVLHSHSRIDTESGVDLDGIFVDHPCVVAIELLVDRLMADRPESRRLTARVDHSSDFVHLTLIGSEPLGKQADFLALCGDGEEELTQPPDVAMWVVHWLVTSCGGRINCSCTDLARITLELPEAANTLKQ